MTDEARRTSGETSRSKTFGDWCVGISSLKHDSAQYSSSHAVRNCELSELSDMTEVTQSSGNSSSPTNIAESSQLGGFSEPPIEASTADACRGIEMSLAGLES